MQTASTFTERVVHLDLSEVEAGKLAWLILHAVDWEMDRHGRFAQDLFEELEAIDVKARMEE